jgi:hypothetical protein
VRPDVAEDCCPGPGVLGVAGAIIIRHALQHHERGFLELPAPLSPVLAFGVAGRLKEIESVNERQRAGRKRSS